MLQIAKRAQPNKPKIKSGMLLCKWVMNEPFLNNGTSTDKRTK